LSLDKNVKEYILDIFDNFKTEKKYEIDDIRSEIQANMLENGKYHLEAMKTVNTQKEQLQEFEELSQGLISNWQTGLESIKDLKNSNISIKKILETTVKDHTEINQTIKVQILLNN